MTASTQCPSIHRDRLLDRFLKYVRVGTAADPKSSTYPSSSGQWELGRLLVQELHAMGLEDARQDSNGLVWALVPGNVAGAATLLLNAHMDTSPEAPGDNVRPRIIENYRGGDIPLEYGGEVIRVETCQALSQLVGHTLVTTDGRTLLGGDDKAGIAAIMELAEHLLEHPTQPHGPIQILFTCDEEIGQGTLKIPVDQLSAIGGYTLDGSGAGELEGENFSADQLAIRAWGHNIHPSLGKGRMVNALRGLSQVVARLPLDKLSPESTDDRDGFLHPYSLESGVGSGQLLVLLRDFETSKLDEYTQLVQSILRDVEAQMPGLKLELHRTRQYRNMAEFLAKQPLVMELADQAFQQLGRTCQRGAIRGGTDGAMLSEKGLPTPNLSVGQHNIHSVLEFVSLNEMVAAVEHLVALADLWQQHLRS